MDEMKIETKFMKSIVSKILRKELRKRTGTDVNVQLGEFQILNMDDRMHVHLTIDADVSRDELIKLLKIAKLYD